MVVGDDDRCGAPRLCQPDEGIRRLLIAVHISARVVAPNHTQTGVEQEQDHPRRNRPAELRQQANGLLRLQHPRVAVGGLMSSGDLGDDRDTHGFHRVEPHGHKLGLGHLQRVSETGKARHLATQQLRHELRIGYYSKHRANVAVRRTSAYTPC